MAYATDTHAKIVQVRLHRRVSCSGARASAPANGVSGGDVGALVARLGARQAQQQRRQRGSGKNARAQRLVVEVHCSLSVCVPRQHVDQGDM